MVTAATRKLSYSRLGIERRFAIPLSLNHISKIPRSPFIVVNVTPALQIPRRVFLPFKNIQWYVAALSKYSLYLSSVFLVGGGCFFIGGADRWSGVLRSVAAANAYPLVRHALVVLFFKNLHMKASLHFGRPTPQRSHTLPPHNLRG